MSPFDYVYNQGWAKFNKSLNKTGFDIFQEATGWPKLFLTRVKQIPVVKKVYITNTSTNMNLRNDDKIIQDFGRCLSYNTSQNKVYGVHCTNTSKFSKGNTLLALKIGNKYKYFGKVYRDLSHCIALKHFK